MTNLSISGEPSKKSERIKQWIRVLCHKSYMSVYWVWMHNQEKLYISPGNVDRNGMSSLCRHEGPRDIPQNLSTSLLRLCLVSLTAEVMKIVTAMRMSENEIICLFPPCFLFKVILRLVPQLLKSLLPNKPGR